MYQYVSKLNRVVDGDTVDLDVDLGFMVSILVRFRLEGINAPEMTGDQRDAGKLSKQHLIDLLTDADQGIIRVDSQGKDKYGRWVARLSCVSAKTGNIVDISKQMVDDGFAKIYVP